MDLEIGLKLLLAAVLGGLMGLERQIRGKPAGLRTNMLICMGATLFMGISLKVAEIFKGDPDRIAAQIITGIGFLGAGAVLHSRGFVLNLTTAATIWVVAGVGMALGAGMYATAVEATILTIAILSVLGIVEGRLEARRGLEYRLLVESLNEGLEAVHRALAVHGVTAVDLSFKREGHNYRVSFHSTAPRETNQKVLDAFALEPTIHEVETSAHVIDSPE